MFLTSESRLFRPHHSSNFHWTIRKTNTITWMVSLQITLETNTSNNNNTHTKELTRKLAGDLFNAFTWDDTEEGQRYWENVSNKLKRIAKEGFWWYVLDVVAQKLILIPEVGSAVNIAMDQSKELLGGRRWKSSVLLWRIYSALDIYAWPRCNAILDMGTVKEEVLMCILCDEVPCRCHCKVLNNYCNLCHHHMKVYDDDDDDLPDFYYNDKRWISDVCRLFEWLPGLRIFLGLDWLGWYLSALPQA